MPIPPFNQHGLLSAGIYDCSFAELKARFGAFRRSDRRQRLCAKLATYLEEARLSGLVVCVLVDGSFVTDQPEPNDIDLIVVVVASHDFAAELDPRAYNVLSKQRVVRRHGFDLLVARDGSLECARWVDFFQQVRLEPGRRKGILRVRL